MPAAEPSKQQPAPTTEVAPSKQKHKLRLPLIVAGASLIIILVILGIFLFPGGEATSQERLPIAVADFVNQTNVAGTGWIVGNADLPLWNNRVDWQ